MIYMDNAGGVSLRRNYTKSITPIPKYIGTKTGFYTSIFSLWRPFVWMNAPPQFLEKLNINA
jgi:hypothetical protein